ncbi:hypothetical protein V1512DRAFT_263994 [Lipomyces arxii]|uniref:uncharacterized protein n=1 Tax=Lipomyces arxii TaxID=56418 RepID=UPI0034CEEDCE
MSSNPEIQQNIQIQPELVHVPAKRGRKPGSKRKRGRVALPKKDEDSEEEFTFEGLETKSGRKVHKPQQFDPLAEQGGRKRTHHFRRDLQVCKVCLRGHSPDANLIVFCDGCNDGYHQLCHDPPIGRAFIDVAEAQWFCSNCQAKIVQRPLEIGMPGDSLTPDEKRSYLLSLPTQHLVELLLLCEQQYPGLRIYSPQTKSILAQRRAGQHTQIPHFVPRAPVDVCFLCIDRNFTDK